MRLPSESSVPLLSPYSLQMVHGKLWQSAKPGQLFADRGAESLESWFWTPPSSPAPPHRAAGAPGCQHAATLCRLLSETLEERVLTTRQGNGGHGQVPRQPRGNGCPQAPPRCHWGPHSARATSWTCHRGHLPLPGGVSQAALCSVRPSPGQKGQLCRRPLPPAALCGVPHIVGAWERNEAHPLTGTGCLGSCTKWVCSCSRGDSKGLLPGLRELRLRRVGQAGQDQGSWSGKKAADSTGPPEPSQPCPH